MKKFKVTYKGKNYKVTARDSIEAVAAVMCINDDRLSPMTYAKLKELGYNSNDWKNWTQEQANAVVERGKKENTLSSSKPYKSEGKSSEEVKIQSESNITKKTEQNQPKQYKSERTFVKEAYNKSKESEKLITENITKLLNDKYPGKDFNIRTSVDNLNYLGETGRIYVYYDKDKYLDSRYLKDIKEIINTTLSKQLGVEEREIKHKNDKPAAYSFESGEILILPKLQLSKENRKSIIDDIKKHGPDKNDLEWALSYEGSISNYIANKPRLKKFSNTLERELNSGSKEQVDNEIDEYVRTRESHPSGDNAVLEAYIQDILNSEEYNNLK